MDWTTAANRAILVTAEWVLISASDTPPTRQGYIYAGLGSCKRLPPAGAELEVTMTAMTPFKKPATKPETILKLVRRKNGATMKAMLDATDWQPHSVRAAISGLRKKGHDIKRFKDSKGVTIYRLTAE